MERHILSELRRRLDQYRKTGDSGPGASDTAEDALARRAAKRLGMAARAVVAKVPDVRLHAASLQRLGPIGTAVANAAVFRRRSAYILGPKGVGKSFIAVAALRLRLELEARAVTESETEWDLDSEVDDLWTQRIQYVSHDSLIRQLQDAYRSDSDPAAVLDTYRRAAFLVLDDLGARTKLSQFAADETAALIDARYTSAAPTVITSNLDLPGIEAMLEAAGPHVGERAVSRIWGLIRGVGLGDGGAPLWPEAEPIVLAGDDRRVPRAAEA